jgi:hypothetical protein
MIGWLNHFIRRYEASGYGRKARKPLYVIAFSLPVW